MKTAMQKYIEYLEEIKDRENIPNSVITTAKNYLPIEKDQIIDAYDSGQENLEYREGWGYFSENTSYEYYDKKFLQ